MQKEFTPKLFSLLKQKISRETFFKDLISGIGLDLRKKIRNNGMYEIIERKYIVPDITKAIQKATKYLEEQS